MMMMMKVAAVVVVAVSAASFAQALEPYSPTNDGGGIIEPQRFSYQQLEDLLFWQQIQQQENGENDDEQHDDDGINITDNSDRNKLNSILQNEGFFSITDIPGMGHFKPKTFQYLVPCLQSGGIGAHQQHVFEDGTIRQTLATTPGNPLLPPSAVGDEEDACMKLEQMSRPFRETVTEVRRTIAELFQLLSGLPQQIPLLLRRNSTTDNGYGYNLQSIINEGQQLEHFHVYRKKATMTEEEEAKKKRTIDWHTDQGLVLIFSPGLLLGDESSTSQQDFYVKMADGTAKAVKFNTNKDELVVMLGEGVHQYVNKDDGHSMKWRAVPHSVNIQQQQQDTPRVWYGLMVLPPSDAIHPFHPQNKTFGELRTEQIINSASPSASSSSFGCGNSNINRIVDEGRILQDAAVTEASCTNETQLYCWHKCMDYTEKISPTACRSAADSDGEAEMEMEVACISSQRQLWTGEHNPDFALGCIDMSTVDTTEAAESGGAGAGAGEHHDHGNGTTTTHTSDEDTEGHPPSSDAEDTTDSSSSSSFMAATFHSIAMVGATAGVAIVLTALL